jgi:hypothetical protein
VQKAEGSDDGMNQEEPSYPQPSDFDDDVPF